MYASVKELLETATSVIPATMAMTLCTKAAAKRCIVCVICAEAVELPQEAPYTLNGQDIPFIRHAKYLNVK
jgi:hypothetical protein